VTNANGTRTIEALADDVDLKVFRATNAADVAALPAVPGYQVSVSGVAAGTFEFSGINFSSAVGSDPLQITYIAPSTDPTGASGAWVRQPEFYNNSSSTLSSESSQSAIDELDGKVDPLLTQSISGSATFENLTNSITLSGIGNLGTLEVGDVVQVTGTASNNKLFTVEVITDNDNVVVNQAHAGGTTTKSLVNETISATITLVTGRFTAPNGVGQGWVRVFDSRSANVTYTNTTGRPISVYVRTYVSSGIPIILVDGVQVGASLDESGSTQRGLNTFIVPDQSEYIVSTGSGITVDGWAELR
jgi:hypothetical protein